ncbi:unnamed protein product [Rhodiola kirilowii]
MDNNMTQLQQSLMEVEFEAEKLLLARHQLVENDRVRNGNREALTALRKRARTTKTSVTLPYGSIMKDVGGPGSKTLVKEVCTTCGNHDSKEKTWMMFPGTDIFAKIPFHAAHTILEKELRKGKGLLNFRKRCPCRQIWSWSSQIASYFDRQTQCEGPCIRFRSSRLMGSFVGTADEQ